jgi:release factor glutamine methyltransferase
MNPAADAALTIGAAVALAAGRLARSGIESSRRDARRLVALAAGLPETIVLGYPERPLDPAAMRRFAALVERRAAREPMGRLAGSREFWSLDFALSPATLEPRPDSETLVQAALDRLPDRTAPLHILDLGTGTGCLLLALLSELPNALGFGFDLVPEAAAQARRNAASMCLDSRAFFAAGRWDEAVAGGFDVVLTNPPYVPTGAIPALMPEVARFEPRIALDGGSDGLQAYRALAPALARLLRPDGFACVELGEGQGEAVAGLFQGAGLDLVQRHNDLAGIERCLVIAARREAKKIVGIYTLPV